MDKTITIAIITYHRPRQLERCLASIVTQSQLPGEVMVIDDDPAQSARPVSDAFTDRLPVRYLGGEKLGFSTARNLALKKCRTARLGFVDDDCRLAARWVQVACAFEFTPTEIYAVGRVDLANPNVLAKAWYECYLEWVYDNVDKQTGRLAPKTLDTKNIVLDMTAVRKSGVAFDEQFNMTGGEDTDFGLELELKGFGGWYCPELVVSHDEPDTLGVFLRKSRLYGKAAARLCRKWNPKGKLIGLVKPPKGRPRWFYDFIYESGRVRQGRHYPEKVIVKLFMKIRGYFYWRGFQSEKKKGH